MEKKYIPRAEQYLYNTLKKDAWKCIGMLDLSIIPKMPPYINFVYQNLMESDKKGLTINGKAIDYTKLSGYMIELMVDLISYFIWNPKVFTKCAHDTTVLLDNVDTIIVYIRSVTSTQCLCDLCKDARQLNVFSVDTNGTVQIKHLHSIFTKIRSYKFSSHEGLRSSLYLLITKSNVAEFSLIATYENRHLILRFNCINCDSNLISKPYHIKFP